MNNDTSYSFIVPVYNVELYLAKCVDSIIGQDYQHSKIEVLLVDDGSTDNSGKMCDEFSDKYSNVFAFHKTNGGLSDARNYGIERAKNDYIIFLDSDDYVDNNLCKEINTLTKQHNSLDIIPFGFEKILNSSSSVKKRTTKEKTLYSGRYFLKTELKNGSLIVAAPMNAYHRSFIINNDLRFLKGYLHEDEEFTPRAYLSAERIAVLNRPFYKYNIRQNSITTSNNLKTNAKCIFDICRRLYPIYDKIEDKELSNLLKTHSAKICYKAIIDAKLLEHNIDNLIDYDLLNACSIYPKERIRYILIVFFPRLFTHMYKLKKRQ